ncbi:hypothetical protein BU23DRAFT_255940 [Bimuria novae-zelandiae CBS 107.79]|uniref:Uncharacterized protein n=1 Tax=Bimuria novae-zelandiae CBS 107.79 TaxID=1447943 RepID=A0A6A5UY83_9PLEO|nr:hypothetical protein BU23DRAFT_255940 [Bimuria novae-zelandiae CBS 107.79]
MLCCNRLVRVDIENQIRAPLRGPIPDTTARSSNNPQPKFVSPNLKASRTTSWSAQVGRHLQKRTTLELYCG